MEEIINKNIFDDRVLLKLSPDYVPSKTLLRLEVRRNMVRDTHVHGTFTHCRSQRKPPKPSKDRVKMNKEIDELRNSFHNINLKNEIMLRNNTDIAQLKPIVEYTPLTDINETSKMDDTDCNKFRLRGNKTAKINENVTDEIKIFNNGFPHTYDRNHGDVFDNIKNDTEIKVENHSNFDDNIDTLCVADEEEIINFAENDQYTDLTVTNSRRVTIDTQISDLQSALIMLAINSQVEEENNDKVVDQSENEILANDVNLHSLVLVSNSLKNESKTEFLNITPLKIIMTDLQKYILKKYVNKWKKYVSKRREYIAHQRQQAINIFFDKLEKKKTGCDNLEQCKSKLLARDYSTYQHRYKMQKHIIALQKAKLEEQNRMIDELKYNKIIESSKQSIDAMKEEVRKTYFEIDRHLKPKIKLLTNELNMAEIEEPSLVLHCLKVPQFLQRMEKRAREREEKHAMIRERKKQMEEERCRLKQQAELAKLEMDKEEKFQRIKELREKRKKERMESIRKKQYADRIRSLTVMADLHYERCLMAKYCIRPLKKLIELKRDNVEKAKTHYNFQLKKNIFLHWMFYTEDKWMERNYRAENFYRTKMFQMVFTAFKKNHHEFVLKRQVAEDYYDLYVSQLIFRKLREGITIVKAENELEIQKAILFYNRNLQFKILTCWRTLPALNALKREQDARKARWREKVLQVVPDYMPPDE